MTYNLSKDQNSIQINVWFYIQLLQTVIHYITLMFGIKLPLLTCARIFEIFFYTFFVSTAFFSNTICSGGLLCSCKHWYQHLITCMLHNSYHQYNKICLLLMRVSFLSCDTEQSRIINGRSDSRQKCTNGFKTNKPHEWKLLSLKKLTF